MGIERTILFLANMCVFELLSFQKFTISKRPYWILTRVLR